jgi:hypothetical protein
MPRHTLTLIVTDAESVADSVKRFLAGIERPLVSIELSTQDHSRSFYGVYNVGWWDCDQLAAKIVKRVPALSSSRSVRIVARSRS